MGASTYLVHVVGKLPLCDGPRPLVVSLEGCNLLAQHGGVGVTCAGQHGQHTVESSGYIGLTCARVLQEQAPACIAAEFDICPTEPAAVYLPLDCLSRDTACTSPRSAYIHDHPSLLQQSNYPTRTATQARASTARTSAAHSP